MFEGVSVLDLNILFYKFRSRLFFINHTSYNKWSYKILFLEREIERERETDRERQREGRNERVQRLKESL